MRQLVRKVPEITVYFWIIKLLTTAMGESFSDFLVHHLDPVFAVCIGAVGFTILLLMQFYVKKYTPWIYWLTVTMVALFGTMAADVMHIVLGIPYLISTICFIVILVVTFGVWHTIEKTLSIHSIFTMRREMFYWSAVVATFALGTALGDVTAITFTLGYLNSGFLFIALFILPFIAYALLHRYEVFLFWSAYIVTRPLGASFADWLGRTQDFGGIGFGTGRTSIVLFVLIILLVGYLTVTKKDVKKSTIL